MQIDLSPVRRDDRLTLSRRGDVLTINGADLDLSVIPEGASLPADAVACGWLTGEIQREGGKLRLSVILPHGADAPPETLHPAPLILTGDGPVALPPYEIEAPTDAD